MNLEEAIAGEPNAADIVQQYQVMTSIRPLERWFGMLVYLARQGASFKSHLAVWKQCVADAEVRPMWIPRAELSESNIAKYLEDSGLENYSEFHNWSISNREEFWQTCVDRLGIAFRNAPSSVVDLSAGVASPDWLPDARLNIVDSCFQATDDSTAIVASNEDGSLQNITVAKLRQKTMQIAGALQAAGFERGDRIGIVMPMTPESVAIYLGIIAAGCTAVSIADSFAAPEISTRLRIADAKGIFCAASFNRAGRAIGLFPRVKDAGAPRAIVIGETNLREGDLLFEEFLTLGQPLAEAVASPASTHINILFSSGTTGDPKAIPWPQTVPIKCAADGMWHHDIRQGDVVVWPTNIGWMMGPWLIFAALMNKATIGLYHDAPMSEGFGQFVQDANVTMLGVVPTIVRAWRASRCMEQFDWSSIRCFSSTGEASSPDDMFYLSWLAGYRPIIEYCGGTEIGGGYACSTVVQPNVPGCFSTAALGSELVLLDEEGNTADQGELFLVPPSMGLSTELLNRDHHATYFEGTPTELGRTLRRHGDYFERLPGGYFRAGGRSDDTMNLGGIKVSSAEIERVLNLIPDVGEAAAIAVSDEGGGPSQLVVFVVPAENCDRETLSDRMNQSIKSSLNPLFRIAKLQFADSLPRTASNKVMRRKLREQFQKQAESRQE